MPAKPRHSYKRGDAAFYTWWEKVYQQQMDLFQICSTGMGTRDDMVQWEILKAYYHGLCDGRKRVNPGPM